ncbi:MAG: hypothetical protein ABJC66_03065 [Gammaproteobacteria bacterium]
MTRRILFLLVAATIYIIVKRGVKTPAERALDQAADADWANEGGRNAPPSV